MSDWAQKAAAKLEKEEADKRLAEQNYALQRAHLNAEAPRLWEVLKESLFNAVTTFGKLRPNYLAMDPDFRALEKVSVQSPKGRLDIRFNASVPDIQFSTKLPVGPVSGTTIMGGYIFEIYEGKVWLRSQYEKPTVETATEELLDTLI